MTADEPRGHLEYAQAIWPIARDLLSRNYDLTPDQMRELLDVKLGDRGNVAMWSEIAKVAIGGEAAFDEEPHPPARADDSAMATPGPAGGET